MNLQRAYGKVTYYSKTKEKIMRILVMTGSPRRNGNSNVLADNYVRGAQEAGHEVLRFDAAFKRVNPCIACDKCMTDGQCVFHDDFDSIREFLIAADMVVFAFPMYYFGISAQLKAVIDRFHAINSHIAGNKRAALLMTYIMPPVFRTTV